MHSRHQTRRGWCAVCSHRRVFPAAIWQHTGSYSHTSYRSAVVQQSLDCQWAGVGSVLTKLLPYHSTAATRQKSDKQCPTTVPPMQQCRPSCCHVACRSLMTNTDHILIVRRKPTVTPTSTLQKCQHLPWSIYNSLNTYNKTCFRRQSVAERRDWLPLPPHSLPWAGHLGVGKCIHKNCWNPVS